MKKILFAAVAALAFVGCAQNEEIENLSKNAEIDFGTVVKGSTRAAITDDSNFKAFTVCGYKSAAKMSTETQLVAGFMNDEKFSYDTEWKHTNSFYWPATGYVQFFATSPEQALTLPKGYPTFTYSVTNVNTDQKDLVAASAIDKAKGDGKITLAFQHLLTQVNFTIKGNTPNFTYKVSKIVLKGAKNAGTFTFDSGVTSVGAWTLDASTADYTYEPSTPVSVATTAECKEETKFESSGNAIFMLMPQDLTSGDIKLDITYSAAPTNNLDNFTFNDTKTVTLKGTWNPATNIRYTLVLTSDAEDISFTPSIGGWDGETTGTNEETTPGA